MKMMMTGMMVAVVATGMAGSAMAQSWTDNLSIKGDARFRYQSTDDDRAAEARERWRFRGRLSVAGKVNDQVKADIRLVTNSGDPISDNITMDGLFDDAPARIDRAVITWTPFDVLSLRMGKMGQPWVAVADLVFSGDVNPEGLAANVKVGMDALELLGHVGGFVLDERRADAETMLLTGQAAVKYKLGKKDYVMAGATLYSYDAVEGREIYGGQNSTVTNEDGDRLYATGFNVVEGFVQAAMDMGVPVKLSGQYMVNTDADEDDTGYLLSASAKLPAGFEVGYQYRHLEKDATFGALAENTDFGSSTDVKGHIPYMKYAISKNFDVKVLYAMGERGLEEGTDITTFKIDLAAKF